MQFLTNIDVKPSGRALRLCPTFCLREARWWLQLEVRKTSNMHYTTALHIIMEQSVINCEGDQKKMFLSHTFSIW